MNGADSASKCCAASVSGHVAAEAAPVCGWPARRVSVEPLSVFRATSISAALYCPSSSCGSPASRVRCALTLHGVSKRCCAPWLKVPASRVKTYGLGVSQPPFYTAHVSGSLLVNRLIEIACINSL